MPDLDAIRERLANTPEPTSIGFASARAHAGLHQSQADVAALMAWGEQLAAEVERLRTELASATGLGERMTLLWDKACGHRDTAREEVARLRPMEAALAAVRELHWPVEYAPDRPDICYTCCTNQAENLEHGYKTCTVAKHKHTPGGPICPTRAALDGGA